MTEYAIEAEQLGKTFDKVTALREVDLLVPRGSVLGLLGHNGAGKTTLVNLLATMLAPSTGTARVAGFDVVAEAAKVRSRIGLTAQFAAVDEDLSGRANLVLIARLLGATRAQARARADELLELFDLTEAAGRGAKTYSGGMRRRLDLAAGIVGHPEVIFLDEPTTGLDPVSRNGMWEIVQNLVGQGTTVLLTTQYLEEADRLADRIVVLSDGSVVADGTAAALKTEIGTRSVAVTVADPATVAPALARLRMAGLSPTADEAAGSLSVPVEDAATVAVIVRALDDAGAVLTAFDIGEPSLDDVYLALAA